MLPGKLLCPVCLVKQWMTTTFPVTAAKIKNTPDLERDLFKAVVLMSARRKYALEADYSINVKDRSFCHGLQKQQLQAVVWSQVLLWDFTYFSSDGKQHEL